MKLIVLATDGSSSAERALAVAIDLCRATGASLLTMAVRPPMRPVRGGAMPLYDIEAPGGAERIARAAADEAAVAGVDASATSAYGEVVPTIAATAEQAGGDLVVVGSRGLGRLSAMLLGSISLELPTRTHLPVVVVPEDGPVRHPVPAARQPSVPLPLV